MRRRRRMPRFWIVWDGCSTGRARMSGLRRLIGYIAWCAVLAGCATTRPAIAPAPWEQRLSELEHASAWQLDGRAAVSLGTQGWQASLDWRQRGDSSEVHLAGPFGGGAP